MKSHYAQNYQLIYDIILLEGLLAKPTHGNIIRFAPPLCINDAEMDQALDILSRALTVK